MQSIAASEAFDMINSQIKHSETFDTIKSQVSHFVENTKALVEVLDTVGKVHPFIQSVSCSAPTLPVTTHSSR